ncbi:hypothetical protein [Hydrogenophaga palleronii]|uniref:hypothetical protein n=1 Tax=Hydrogenophaga palleronii TaxID=65655 RepID=UPI0008265CBC|nr:hypothetical protein [Hydrogenophaga palleronii]
MTKINRALQLELLNRLAKQYPLQVDVQTWDEELPGAFANLAYLAEYRLVDLGGEGQLSADYEVAFASITAAGLDFLADDGGLSAVLGVVTIKIHSDSIKDLIALRIDQSDLAPAEKKRWLDSLRALPAETTKHLVLKLVDKGLESGPQAIQWLGNLLQQQPPG